MPLLPGILGRSPSFGRLLAARGLSMLGDGAGALALVVHVEREEGTGTAVGLLLLVASLPRLLAPLAGALADRLDRRRVLVAAELAQAALVGAAAIWLPPLPVLLALVLGKAAAASVAEPAGQAAVPSLVDDADLTSANALVGGARQVGEVAGPVTGGILVALGGVRLGLAVDALTFVLAVPLLLRVPRMPVDRAVGAEEKRGVVGDALEGLRYVLADRVTRGVTVVFFLAGLGAADDVALPFLAETLGAGPRGIGTLYASVGAGLLVGYALLVRAGRHLGPRSGLALGAAVAGAGNALTGVSPVIAAAVAFQVLRGIGLAALEANVQTLVQRRVPPRLMGRAFANLYGAVNLAATASLLGGGLLLDATSARTVLVAAGGVGVLGAAAGVVVLRRADGRP